MAAIDFSMAEFPIVISRFPAVFSEAEVDTYFDAMRAMLDRNEPYVHIADLTLAGAMSSAGMRKKAADFMGEQRPRTERLCRGAVQVAPSALVRGVMTALHWVNPPPFPSALAATFDEAMMWAEQRCTAAELIVP